MSPEQLPSFILTKTKFRQFIECKREFWLRHHHPHAIVKSIDLATRVRFEEGKEVQKLARATPRLRKLFEEDRLEYERDVRIGSLQARLDAIERSGEGTTIYEIKAKKHIPADCPTKKRNDRQTLLFDLGFQVLVARKAGIEVDRAVLVTLDGDYVRAGEIDAEGLFHFEDVTFEINAFQKDIESCSKGALEMIRTAPSSGFDDLCKRKLRCPYFEFTQPDLPKLTIFDIPGLRGKRYDKLVATGAIGIEDVDEAAELTENQWNWIRNMLDPPDEIVIKRQEIKEMLDLEYPLYFLDYETFNPAVPQFDGMKPYENITFQYSVHVQHREGEKPEHFSYLADGKGEFQKELVESLQAAIKPGGTVVSWSEGFENRRNTELANLYPEYREFLESLNERSFDLALPFRKDLYNDPGINGWSLKTVQPALAPDLPYSALNINEGGDASARWYVDVFKGTDRKGKTMKELESYCRQDTLVMVRILERLRQIIGPAAGSQP